MMIIRLSLIKQLHRKNLTTLLLLAAVKIINCIIWRAMKYSWCLSIEIYASVNEVIKTTFSSWHLSCFDINFDSATNGCRYYIVCVASHTHTITCIHNTLWPKLPLPQRQLMWRINNLLTFAMTIEWKQTTTGWQRERERGRNRVVYRHNNQLNGNTIATSVTWQQTAAMLSSPCYKFIHLIAHQHKLNTCWKKIYLLDWIGLFDWFNLNL